MPVIGIKEDGRTGLLLFTIELPFWAGAEA